jgi:ABC-type multidrug transport system ATPase subunit
VGRLATEDTLMIETRGMTKVFGGLVAVNDLDMKVRRGTIHGFVGPNGAGKTTTIKMLVGLLRCSSGKGLIKGLAAGSKDARRIVGYSPERPPLYSDMTTEDYLKFMARLSGLKSAEAVNRTAELLDLVELTGFKDSKVGGFSAGMKQRLGLAQALVNHPELIILDEPTANLDPTGRRTVINKLKKLNYEHNITILISSHILPELEQLIDSVTLINKGKSVIENDLDQVKEDFKRDRYRINTSDNKRVIDTLKVKSYVDDIQVDQAGDIHITCLDAQILQDDLIDIITEHKLRLTTFDEETIKLDDIYSQSLNIGEEQ